LPRRCFPDHQEFELFGFGVFAGAFDVANIFRAPSAELKNEQTRAGFPRVFEVTVDAVDDGVGLELVGRFDAAPFDGVIGFAGELAGGVVHDGGVKVGDARAEFDVDPTALIAGKDEFLAAEAGAGSAKESPASGTLE